MSDDTLGRFLTFAGVSDGARISIGARGALTPASQLPRRGARQGSSPVLVFQWLDLLEHQALLRAISGGSVIAVSSVDAGPIEISWCAEATQFRPELAGMRVHVPPLMNGFVTFELNHDGGDAIVEVLARCNDRPWLLRVNRARTVVYLLGITDFPDVEASVTSEEQGNALASILLPVLLFLREHYPQETWVPGSAPIANFIIDDPLLKPKYGFMDHAVFTKRVQALDAAATIAFIPWNARRSSPAVVDLYKTEERLSLCAHGFEHTAGEFADTDAVRLRWRAAAAMQGMQLHERLTGVDFDRVMVFPQGKFSRQGMQALAESSFVAAINSHYLATNHGNTVRLKHLMEPAVTCYGGCPLFGRRYPSELDALRCDLALGRPAFLVEHHGYFRDNGAQFSAVVHEIRKMQPSIRWARPEEAVQRACLIRRCSSNDHQVRFYSRSFIFRSDPGGNRTYRFEKIEPDADEICRVTVNNQPVDFSHSGSRLSFCVELPAEQRVQICIETRKLVPEYVPKLNRLSHRAKVAMRRYLSEFRDDRIQTSRFLAACLTAVRRAL